MKCRHCAYMPADDDAVPGLCQQCADLAVWGAACHDCGRVPTGRESVGDYELAVRGICRPTPPYVDRTHPDAVALAEKRGRCPGPAGCEPNPAGTACRYCGRLATDGGPVYIVTDAAGRVRLELEN